MQGPFKKLAALTLAALIATSGTVTGIRVSADQQPQSMAPFLPTVYSGNSTYNAGLESLIAYKTMDTTVIERVSQNLSHQVITQLTPNDFLFNTKDGGPAWLNLQTAKVGRIDPVTLTRQEQALSLTGLPKGAKLLSALSYQHTWAALLEKKGVFVYDDANAQWTPINSQLPKVDNSEDVNVSKLLTAQDELYVLSRAKGIFKFDSGKNQWELLPGIGAIAAEVKAFYTFEKFDGRYIVGTKTGLFEKPEAEASADWKPIKGTGDEIEATFRVNQRLFVYAHEEKRMYYQDDMKILRPLNIDFNRVLDGKVSGMSTVGKYYIFATDSGFTAKQLTLTTQKPSDVAKAISALPKQVPNATTLVLPTLPYGFKATISTSDQPKVLSLKGDIVPPQQLTKVKLVLKITQDNNKEVSYTKPLTVEVPAKRAKSAYDGLYSSSAQGYNEMVQVEAVVSGGVLTQVKVRDHRETDSMNTVKEALTQLPAQMVSRQTLEVDSVTGATFTSRAVLTATQQALKGTPFYKMPNAAFKVIDSGEVEGLAVIKSKNGIVYAQYDKTKKKSTLMSVNQGDLMTPLLLDLPTIDAGLTLQNGSVLVLLGTKDEPLLLKSTDGGDTWVKAAAPKGLPKEKMESLLETEDGRWFASINKNGLYESNDQGATWKNISQGLPTNPDVIGEPDMRKIVMIDHQLYVLTKKNGVYTQAANGSWKPLTSQGLPYAAQDVWDLTFFNKQYYMMTKGGLYTAPAKAPIQWTKLSSFNEEGRQLVMKAGQLYGLSKRLNLYKISGTMVTLVQAKPVALTGSDSKDLLLVQDTAWLPNKTGLVQLQLK